IECCDLVAERDADPDRRQVADLGRMAGKIAQPAHGLANRAEGRPVAVRPRLAVARDAGEDATRVLRLHDLEAEPPLLELARPIVFDHDVRPAEQPTRQGLSLGMFEVEGDASLVARLQRPGQGLLARAHAPAAKRIALARGLRLDHVRAQIAEQPGAERPGNEVPKLQDLEATQRAGRRVVLPSAERHRHLLPPRAAAAGPLPTAPGRPVAGGGPGRPERARRSRPARGHTGSPWACPAWSTCARRTATPAGSSVRRSRP